MNRNKTVWTLAAVAMTTLVLMSTSADAQIVYQDTFDDDGLDVNTGIGGGIADLNIPGASVAEFFDDGNDLDMVTGGGWGGNRGYAESLDGFNLSGGFTLEVTYTVQIPSGGNANRAMFGLWDGNGTNPSENFLGTNNDRYGIGVNILSTNQGSTGLNSADDAGAGSITPLSDDQIISGGMHTLVLEMDTADNWSYSIDGAPASTGTIGAGFDLSRTYNFIVYAQDNENDVRVLSVTLTAPGQTSGPQFIRGDANGDGQLIGLVDALYVLVFQFQGGPVPPCFEAADVNDDGSFSGLVDALYILAFQFQGGPPPPAPSPPNCGVDPDPPGLGCIESCP